MQWKGNRVHVYSFELSQTQEKTGLWLAVTERKVLLFLQKLRLAFKIHYNCVMRCLSKIVFRINTYMDLCTSLFQRLYTVFFYVPRCLPEETEMRLHKEIGPACLYLQLI